MTKMLLRGLIIFFVLLVASSMMVDFFNTQFGDVDYFNVHGFILLIGLALFPRFSLLVSSIPFGGLGWWLGFLFFPRVLIALLATTHYFKTNPVLVVISWMVALGGEFWEKRTVSRRNFSSYSFRAPQFTFRPKNRTSDQHSTHLAQEEIIEAEARIIK